MNDHPSRRRRLPVPLVLLIVIAGLVAACSGAASPEGGQRAIVPQDGLGAEPPAAGEPEVARRAQALAEGDGGDPAAPATQDGALIIRTGTLELEVADIGATLPQARAAIVGLGGYVSASDEIDRGDWRAATITYRIPVDRWQVAIDELRLLGDRVLREATQAQEVTTQVVDLKARIANLRASEEALMAIMDKSGSIEDVVMVQQRLFEVRGEIERLVAQQLDLETRAALATLTVTWSAPVVAVAVIAAGWDLGQVIDGAAAQTVAAGQWLVSALVWLVIVGLPVIGVPLLLIAGAVLLLRRRTVRAPAP